MIIKLNKKGYTFSREIQEKIELFFTTKGDDTLISLDYITTKQDSSNCLLITLTFKSEFIKDYRIRFMDVEGNILEDNIFSKLLEIKKDIISNYDQKLTIDNLERFENNFYEYLEDIIVGTAFKRKIDLHDFFDPEVWKNSEIELPKPTGNYETSYKIANLRETQKRRIEEENNPVKSVTKI